MGTERVVRSVPQTVQTTIWTYFLSTSTAFLGVSSSKQTVSTLASCTSSNTLTLPKSGFASPPMKISFPTPSPKVLCHVFHRIINNGCHVDRAGARQTPSDIHNDQNGPHHISVPFLNLSLEKVIMSSSCVFLLQAPHVHAPHRITILQVAPCNLRSHIASDLPKGTRWERTAASSLPTYYP